MATYPDIPNVSEMVRQGDPQAIALLLRYRLRSEGVSVRVVAQATVLQVLLEADAVPDQRRCLEQVKEMLRGLVTTSVTQVRVYGRQHHASTAAWYEPITLATALECINLDRFIVCGLGSLGQYCVLSLRKFASEDYGVEVTAIDRHCPDDWESDELSDLIPGHLVVGDCRREEVLEQAGIHQSRGILLVTNDEEVNIEAAIAARRLNPTIRLVIRSSRQNLNELLAEQLQNLAAFEPTELSATPFALAALGATTIGLFSIGPYRFRVVNDLVSPDDYRFYNIPASQVHKRSHRLVHGVHQAPPLAPVPVALAHYTFFQWPVTATLQPGDRIRYVEVMDGLSATPAPSQNRRQWLRQLITEMGWGNWQGQGSRVWQWFHEKRSRQVIGIGSLAALSLWILGTLLLRFKVPAMTWQYAMSSATILLLGGYGDVFGGLTPEVVVPWWVQLLCLLITIASLVFVLGVLGLIADNILSSRFDFLRRKPAIPKRDHIVLLGFRRVGRQVAALIKAINQPIVVLEEHLVDPSVPADIPLILGNFLKDLAKTNPTTAKSIILATEDQMLNLELALIAQKAARREQRDLGLVIRTYDQRFSNELANLLPKAQSLCAYSLAAEAFAGSAFGETMLSLFRMDDRTILVTDYSIEAGDTLVNKLLAQVAYGYRVVPVFYQRREQRLAGDDTGLTMPPDTLRLSAGDRLVVLASVNGLQRIERGELLPLQQWRLQADRPRSLGGLFDAGNCLENISGCDLKTARDFMDSLPGAIDLALYEQQAHHLEMELKKRLPITLTRLTPH